ncbi:YadA-like family protein [Lysobacter arenosi]|uniref:YadA-like family protein n=1 Tax=Lysobacter arenosi TaxID=2795387 RepID=A0ABX7R9N3_9GAMM|nr:ESPR-type extended signal peptide-containing protein [Lysobacter arenosi]QSX74700.1 YadA-like family protein [Lysobacter arenosi]
MNTIYNVVWNSTTGTWVVASEMAKGRKKKPSTTSGAAAAAAAVGVGTMLLAGGAMAVGSRLPSGVIATKAYGGLVLCQSESDFSTVKGMSSGTLGSTGALCNGGPAIDYDMSFGLFNRSINQYGGGYGYDATASVTGFADGLLEVRGTQGISMLNTTLMNNNKITELAAGSVSSSSAEAINGSQLYALQTRVDNLSTSGDVKYFHTNTNLGDSVTTGEHSIAIGGNAASKGLWSVSIGTNSQATGSNSVAIGNSSVADRNTSVSVGNSGTQRQITYMAAGTQNTDAVNVSQLKGVTTALGGGAQVNTDGSVKAPSYVVGGNSYNNVGDAISAVSTSGSDNKYFKTIGGGEAQVSGNNSSAMGSGAAATIAYGTAVGSEAKVTGFEGTAVGYGSKVTGYIGTALGFASEASGKRSIAIGSLAIADADAENGIAIGRQSHVTAKEAVALGSGSLANREYTVSVGNVASEGVPAVTRQVVNMAAGTQNTDAVNVSQLKGVTTALGGGAQVNTDGSVKAPTYNVAGGSFNDVGNAIAAMDAKNSAGMKYFHTSSTLADSQANGVESLAIGGNAVATENAVTIGANSKTSAYGDVVIGMDAKSITNGANNVGNGSTVVGYAASSTAMSGTAIGNGATANGISSSALGRLSKATGLYSVAVGSRNLAQADNSVALGSRSLADRANTVSVGAATPFVDAAGNPQVASTRQIVNMGKGVEDTDAVNVSQLKGVTAALGGGSVVSGDGTVTMPVYKVGDKDQIGIAAAIDALDKKPGGSSPNAVVYDGDDHLQITLAGKDGAATKITNVADGKLEAGSKDAVNGDQLYNVKKDLDVIAPKLKYLKFGVTKADEANAGGADSVAIGGNAYASGASSLALGLNARSSSPNTLAAGVGSLAGADSAVALGSGARVLGANSVALGAGSQVGSTDTWVVSVGSGANKRRITNVDDGKVDTDAATVGQMNKAIAIAIAPKSSRSLLVPLAAPTSSVPVDKLIAAGPTTLGDQLQVSGEDALAIGLNTHATADHAVANGSNVTVTKKDAVGVGSNVTAGGERSVVIGTEVSATADDTAVFGSHSAAEAVNSVAIGAYASVVSTADGSVAIGRDTLAEAKGTVVLGQGSTDDLRANTVSVGTSGGAGVKRQIINVAKGTLDTDAVNVSQLKGVTDALGGKAGVNGTNGTITAPDYVLDKGITTVHNVGDAITNIDGRVTNIVQGKAGLVQQANSGADLTVGKDTDGVGVNFAGTAGVRILRGVAPGKMDTDAVNISQLKDVASVISKDATVDAATGKVTMPAVTVAGKEYDDIIAAINGVATGTSPLGVVYDNDTKASVTFGGGVNGTALKNVAAGVVSTDSKEAINGGQLFAAGKSVADALGGGATMGSDGKVTAPTFNIDGKDKNTVGDALEAVEALAKTGNTLGVAYDDESKASVTLNNGGAPVKLGNVKNGVAQNDAVNFSQLKPVVDGLGGGAEVDPTTGAVTGPTYELEGGKTEVHNVGDAITNLDNRTTQNTTNIQQVIDGKVGLVQQEAAGAKLTVGKDTDGTEVNFTGKAGDRKLTGVAKGTAANDAVNVSQLGGLIDPKGDLRDVVLYDTDSNKATVTFGGGANGTVLNNVADGRIGAGSREAINGGQIAAIKDALEGKITNIDNRVTRIENNGVGGGAPGYISANGLGGSPKPADAGNSPGVAMGFDSNASGDGASALGDHATAAGKNSVAIGNDAKATAAGTNSVALGNGSIADRADSVSVGSAGHERTVSNVARGTADTDAVNVGLLNDRINALGNSSNAYTDKMVNDVWSNLKEEIDHSNRQANRGIAAASALINVTPYVPGHTTVNAGVAGYRGESALGVGVSRWSENGRVNLNAGVSAAQGDEPVYRVGIGYIF